ncbi:hypothetical protein HS048_34625 [Planomonospora sp. ID91781]|uniref:TraG/VirB4 family ATPase n=1 Tax=Planomonospora sp. ID91781 TaxID=2738135 RepID=UPI0018C36828|nr:hypothetical protein [Planomonospora sp. ID91781]MBG0825821.1 hypothetical protein [Planomonospora sp. ID91781]
MWLKRRSRPDGPLAKVDVQVPRVRRTRTAAAARPGPTWAAETVPGVLGDGALRPMSGRQLRRLHLPPHRATTDVLQAVYPWMADAGAGALGPLVGHNLLGGGTWCYDPWEYYDAGLVTNPNLMVLGEIGSRKSTLVKCMIARGYEFGRDAYITDVKDEYSDLADFVGASPVFLGPGLPARLNPFDAGPLGSSDPDLVAERQLAMLVALGTAVLDRPLSQAEHTLCKIAMAEVTDGALHLRPSLDPHGGPVAAVAAADRPRVPVLGDVINAMMDPAQRLVDQLPITRTELRDKTADLIMGMQRLVDGDLRGMFDAPTNIDAGPHSRLIVINLSRILAQRRSALPLVRICATSWLQSALGQRDGRRRFVVSDEAWADLTLGTLRWYQSMRKLARANLVANVLVFHQPADLHAAGDAGSERESLALGLIADTGTVVLYQQKSGQVPLCTRYFGLNATEEQIVTDLRPGIGLWKVAGRRSFLIQHVRSRAEARFTHTDYRPPASAGPSGPGEQLTLPVGTDPPAEPAAPASGRTGRRAPRGANGASGARP